MNSSKCLTLLLFGPFLTCNENLIEFLNNSGFNTLIAHSEDIFIQLFNSSKPDIVLLGLDSIQLVQNTLEAAKKNYSYSSIPFLIITSKETKELCHISAQFGITDIITCPFYEKDILFRVLNRMSIIEIERKNKLLTDRINKLEQMLVTDELTGLYNRRYIIDRLPSEMSHSVRYNEPITFIMLDIDFFKKINDECGHLAGDQFLIEASRQIRKSVREGDIPVRYGGEEFLVVCPNTDLNGGKTLAERIRKNIKGAFISVNNKKISTTISLGVRSILLKDTVNLEQSMNLMIHQADLALLKAKKSGRNRVVIYHEKDMQLQVSEKVEDSWILKKSTELPDDYDH
ncbi:MAG: diguanylate cyclase protein [Clostridiales bacterium]|nr:diguanylate cyclase protein [Clostridiales bacterium]